MTARTLINPDKLVLDVKELSEVLGISKPVAYELIKKNGFPSVRVSERRIIIPVEPLCAWLEQQAGISYKI